MIEQAKFTYSPLGKAFEKQIKKQIDALKSLNLFNKIDELNPVKSLFPQNHMNDLILDRLKKIKQMQDDTELSELDCKAKSGKNYNLNKNPLPIIFLKHIHTGVLLLVGVEKNKVSYLQN